MRIRIGRSTQLKRTPNARPQSNAPASHRGFRRRRLRRKDDVAKVGRQREIQSVLNRFRLPREWQICRCIAQSGRMRRKRGRKALDVFIGSRINKVDIVGHAGRAMKNSRHAADENEINLSTNKRRNDLRQINGHRRIGSCGRGAALQPFAMRVDAFARVARTSVSDSRVRASDRSRALTGRSSLCCSSRSFPTIIASKSPPRRLLASASARSKSSGRELRGLRRRHRAESDSQVMPRH
jgi:hypothetical protein